MMLDSQIEKMMYDNSRDLARKPSLQYRDEVDEAEDASFPASDPPAYTSAAPRKNVKYAETPATSRT